MRNMLPVLLVSYVIFSHHAVAKKPPSEEVATKISTIIDAKPLIRVPPKYPVKDARAGRDGWVVVSYIVEPDGSTSNVLVEDSSGSKSFEKETRRAVKKWSFNPAIENGEAIQQCKNTVQLDFKMHREKEGVSKKFLRLFNKVNQALEQEVSPKTIELFEKLANWEQYTYLESFYKHSLLAQYQEKLKNSKAQLKHINKAISFSGSYDYFKRLNNEKAISSEGHRVQPKSDEIAKYSSKEDQALDERLYPMFHQKLVLEIELNLVGQALNSVNNLLLLKSNENQHASYLKHKNLLSDFIKSDQQLVVTGDIKKNDFWKHKLLRNQFSFTDIVGTLTKIDLRCSNKRHVYTINDSSTWTIPRQWKDCSIYVYGEDNATFTIIESNEVVEKSNIVAAVN